MICEEILHFLGLFLTQFGERTIEIMCELEAFLDVFIKFLWNRICLFDRVADLIMNSLCIYSDEKKQTGRVLHIIRVLRTQAIVNTPIWVICAGDLGWEWHGLVLLGVREHGSITTEPPHHQRCLGR